jgi:hypothetical protein
MACMYTVTPNKKQRAERMACILQAGEPSCAQHLRTEPTTQQKSLSTCAANVLTLKAKLHHKHLLHDWDQHLPTWIT